MKTNFTNLNFEKDINLPVNIKSLNNDIKKICHELPALNILKDDNLLDYTIAVSYTHLTLPTILLV